LLLTNAMLVQECPPPRRSQVETLATQYLDVGLRARNKCWDEDATYFRARIHRTDGIVVLTKLGRRGEKRTSNRHVEFLR